MAMTIKEDFKLQQKEAEAMKRAAFFGITVSTMATLTSIIAVPLLYNYMHHIQSSLEVEVHYCKHLTNNLWQQFDKIQLSTNNGNIHTNDRLKRQVIWRITGKKRKTRKQNQRPKIQVYSVREEIVPYNGDNVKEEEERKKNDNKDKELINKEMISSDTYETYNGNGW
ncbi:unnamed protein product [Onchocerca ochengi]|uniref:Col_cuticle_N domain-containing protein n=1 Tax=Onchocerca ochengi TaxID=42157 RepID=A0A182ELP3_ONCOC|nr:unnamed protein product [Onchocerca ochengi]